MAETRNAKLRMDLRLIFVMGRRLFNLLAGASFLACVASIVLSGWTHASPRMITTLRTNRYSIISGHGDLAILRSELWLIFGGENMQPIRVAYKARREFQWGFDWQAPLDRSDGVIGLSSSIPNWIPEGPSRFGMRMVSFGNGLYAEDDAATECVNMLVIPFWILAAGFALVPGVWFALRRRCRYREVRRLCHACRYDLRATPSRCPECGLVPKLVNVRHAMLVKEPDL